MKFKKVLPALVLVPVLFLALFVYLTQRMVNDGFAVGDNYCIRVNPIIIARKNSYTKLVNFLKAPGSEDEFLKIEDEYRQILFKNILAEEDWLVEQNKFMQRRDYNLLAVPETKQAVTLEYQINTQENIMSKLLMDMFNNLDNTQAQAQIFQKTVEAAKKREELNQSYDKAVVKIYQSNDPRYKLYKPPASKCPKENQIIPEVPDLFAPKTPSVPTNLNPFSIS